MSKKLDAGLRRTLDITASLAGLFLLSPILILLGLAVKLTSKGPVFYRARRVGRQARPFHLLKFRTMVAEADRIGPGLTLDGDSRITRTGQALRAHRLDELPQLWNVLVGDMSLVGSRPEDPRYVAHYTEDQREILKSRPGVTGPAQIAFRNEPERLRHALDPEGVYLREIMPAKLAIDLAYLRRRSVWTDLGILFSTLRIYVGNRILVVMDIFSLVVSYVLAFAIRFDDIRFFEIFGLYWPVFFPLLLIKLIVFEAMGLYRRLWRYASVRELLSVVWAVALSSLLCGIFVLVLWLWPADTFVTGFPRSVIVIDAMLTLLLVGGVRFTARWRQETQRPAAARSNAADTGDQPALIVGAGDAGAMAAREMLRNPQLGYHLVGFLDDDPDKLGLRIHGLPVVGALADLPRCVQELQVRQVLIAMPTASGAAVRRVVQLAQSAAVEIRTLPGYYELIGGQVSVQRARAVQLEDLLRRAPTPLDLQGVASYLTNGVVLVVGAGGSIGSEICRQVARFGPSRLLLMGHGEDSLYRIDRELRTSFPGLNCQPVLGTVRERGKLQWLLAQCKPSVIFHAAAYKHVPLMESNQDEAVLNNIVGTRNLLLAAETEGVPRLVFISSDKAVEPANVMGATKRIGELLVRCAARRSGRPFVVVRFGNVLGSRGSVVPLFQEQIASGGPVTITHPDVTRYFMTIPEAVRLVLQAGALGRGGEVFVLDMGEPVRIYDLACDLIRLHGYEPERDVPVVFIGLRPGEKLHEKLYTMTEHTQDTAHPGIRVATHDSDLSPDELDAIVDELEQLATDRRLAALQKRLVRLTALESVNGGAHQ
jgi:FlaA1/EpsC-like NDP-sugar epimerase/lipopolysaccharide/colanic/teichoic acid biosynthesis glycosyltransferase